MAVCSLSVSNSHTYNIFHWKQGTKCHHALLLLCLQHYQTGQDNMSQCVFLSFFFLRATLLHNFITFSHHAVGLDRKGEATVTWQHSAKWDLSPAVIKQGCFSSKHSITNQPQSHERIGLSVKETSRPALDFWLTEFALQKGHLSGPHGIKSWLEHTFPRTIYFFSKPARRTFRFLLAKPSRVWSFEAQLDDLKVLTNYAGEMAWSSYVYP